MSQKLQQGLVVEQVQDTLQQVVTVSKQAVQEVVAAIDPQQQQRRTIDSNATTTSSSTSSSPPLPPHCATAALDQQPSKQPLRAVAKQAHGLAQAVAEDVHSASQGAYQRYGPHFTAAGVRLVGKTAAALGVEVIGKDNTAKAIGQLGSTNAAAATEELGVTGVLKVRGCVRMVGGGGRNSGGIVSAADPLGSTTPEYLRIQVCSINSQHDKTPLRPCRVHCCSLCPAANNFIECKQVSKRLGPVGLWKVLAKLGPRGVLNLGGHIMSRSADYVRAQARRLNPEQAEEGGEDFSRSADGRLLQELKHNSSSSSSRRGRVRQQQSGVVALAAAMAQVLLMALAGGRNSVSRRQTRRCSNRYK